MGNMDYASNSNKDRESKRDGPDPKKDLDKVISGKGKIKKKGIARKFKEVFLATDFKTAFFEVITDTLIPAAKRAMFESGQEYLSQIMFKESARGRSIGRAPRIDYRGPIGRSAPRENRIIERVSRQTWDDVILPTREDAEVALERMKDIIDSYGVVTVADLCEIIEVSAPHTYEKWGWDYLTGVQVRPTRDGEFLLDLPPPQPIT